MVNTTFEEPSPGSALELPFKSELVVHEACREVRERDGYFVVGDSNNECFYWGNYLHLKKVPEGQNARAHLRAYAVRAERGGTGSRMLGGGFRRREACGRSGNLLVGEPLPVPGDRHAS